MRSILLTDRRSAPPRNLRSPRCRFTPDGRILFSVGKDLFIAESDGSNPRKLISKDGVIAEPRMSPDNKHVVFTVHLQDPNYMVVANADGSDPHSIVLASEGRHVCCAEWTPDGRYIVFQDFTDRGQRNLWIAQWKTGLFQRAHPPVQLTNGPLSYMGPTPSRDGKQIYAVGTKHRGEVVRYDVNSKQFVPVLPSISAFNPTFSSDGKWVAYTSYPDHTLWRSRADGTAPFATDVSSGAGVLLVHFP